MELAIENKNEKKVLKKRKGRTTLVKRLVKDVKDIIKKPLLDNGIIYSHSDENLLKGYAIIFGPKDTIYQNGAYFFENASIEKSPPFSKALTKN